MKPPLRLPLVISLTLASGLCASLAQAQRTVDGQRRYGHEWIEGGVDYLKLAVTEEGVYRIAYDDLRAAGWGDVTGADLKLQQYGEEVALYVPNDGSWSAGDFAEFVNDASRRAAYDGEVYIGGPAGNLNPDFALFSDTIALALSREPGVAHARLAVVDGAYAGADGGSAGAYATARRSTDEFGFAKQILDGEGQKYSSFRRGEGWANSLILRQSHDFVTAQATNDRPAKFEARVVASYNRLGDAAGVTRQAEFSFNDQVLRTDSARRNELLDVSFEVPAAVLSGETQRLTIYGTTGQIWDRYGLGMARLHYAADLAVGSRQTVRAPFPEDLAAGKHTWRELDPGAEHRVYDLVGGRVQVLPRTATATSVLPGLRPDARLFVANGRTAMRPTYGDYVTGTATDLDAADYVIITTHAFDDWSVGPEAYADMRRSSVFGGHDVRVVYIEDLYDQFGYGQPRDPRAVRNAIQYYATEGSAKYVLLMGKGREFEAIRAPVNVSLPRNASAYIPTFGLPGADNLLAVDAQTRQMTVAIGRFALETEADLRIIREKVEATERARLLPQTIDNHAWQKKVVHLSGGGQAAEQAQIKGRMARMQRTYEATMRAPAFSVFGKESSQPVQESRRKEIYDAINDGASIVTFFGHASAGTFDFNIDSPKFYENEDKYPALIALGCYAGNMHSVGKSIGERFLLYEDKGFSSFGASIGLGYTGDLERFTTELYGKLGGDARDEPFAESLRHALNMALQSGGSTLQQLGEQFTFQGDPAMLLYSDPGPDYIVEVDSVSAGPADGGKLRYRVPLRNVGLLGTDSVEVRVYRASPARSRTLIDSFRVGPFPIAEDIGREVEGWGDEGAGLNRLFIELSTPNQTEAPAPGAIANNRDDGFEFFIGLAGIQIAWPLADALLEQDSVRCLAYVADIFGDARAVTWQLATDRGFANTIASASAEARGVFEWTPTADLRPGDTYHLRVVSDAADGVDSRVVTFTVAENGSLPGGSFHAALSSSDQLQDGSTLETMRFDESGGLEFVGVGFYVGLRNLEFDPDNQPHLTYDFGQPVLSFRPWSTIEEGLGIGYIAPRANSLTFSTGVATAYGAVPCTGRSFCFQTETAEQRANIVRFLDEVVPDSSFVIVMSVFDQEAEFDFDAWADDARPLGPLLDAMGAERATEWTSGATRPYSLIFRKGVGLMEEALADARDEVLTTTTFFPIDGDEGTYQTAPLEQIGDYASVGYEFEDAPLDSFRVSLVELRPDTAVVLQQSGERAHDFDLSGYEADPDYRLALRFYQKDTTFYIARSVERIRMTFTPSPDVALTPAPTDESPDSLTIGQAYETSVSVANLSPVPAPAVRFRLSQNGGQGGEAYVDTLGTLDPWQTRDVDAVLTPRDEGGSATLRYEASTAGRERVQFNNLAERSTFVRSDGTPPGVQVRVNGDQPSPGVTLVSAPVFQIVAQDDNVYRELDVDNLVVELTGPDGTTYSRVENSLPGRIELTDRSTADGPTPMQRASFEYEPAELQDGRYELRVGVSDDGGNRDRTLQLVRFELDNRTAISNVLPYPNPGVDNVRFQYEATGSVPQQFQINIYTTAGRLVHSLTEVELGALRNGRNLTEGAWDGTDQFGQRLGRGVYLYRFETSDETGELEQRQTAMDDYVKSGFGKLVLLK